MSAFEKLNSDGDAACELAGELAGEPIGEPFAPRRDLLERIVGRGEGRTAGRGGSVSHAS